MVVYKKWINSIKTCGSDGDNKFSLTDFKIKNKKILIRILSTNFTQSYPQKMWKTLGGPKEINETILYPGKFKQRAWLGWTNDKL